MSELLICVGNKNSGAVFSLRKALSLQERHRRLGQYQFALQSAVLTFDSVPTLRRGETLFAEWLAFRSSSKRTTRRNIKAQPLIPTSKHTVKNRWE
jgi:hypothetical protein